MEELKKPMISKEVENGGETVISEEIRKIIEYKKGAGIFVKQYKFVIKLTGEI